MSAPEETAFFPDRPPFPVLPRGRRNVPKVFSFIFLPGEVLKVLRTHFLLSPPPSVKCTSNTVLILSEFIKVIGAKIKRIAFPSPLLELASLRGPD